MKKFLLLIFFSISLVLYAHGSTLAEHSRIKKLSSFRIMGEIDLRTEKDYSVKVKYRTLNHESGLYKTSVKRTPSLSPIAMTSPRAKIFPVGNGMLLT